MTIVIFRILVPGGRVSASEFGEEGQKEPGDILGRTRNEREANIQRGEVALNAVVVVEGRNV